MTAPVKVRLPLLDRYLFEQRELTAVERFSRQHDSGELTHGEIVYRDLIPLTKPRAGQQYAFEVDLDACTGCKACVTACHRLNGLDGEEAETWRAVGLLHGGSPEEPVQQTVTTACHHCADPGCLKGCPVNAYEKDPHTGIVKHLDDQCIGCQYCTLTCPYEVPQFSKKRGIVRKCDMCSDRLAEGEAPACVQACPNSAIRITVVDKARMIEDAQTDQFLPAAPSPNITIPATKYRSKRPLPRNMLPADFYSVRASKQHWPLVFMLVLTQLAAGAFVVDFALGRFGVDIWVNQTRPYQALFAMAAGLLALGASTLHLGRPLYAFRAVLGVRRSWLSREIIAFGLFATSSVAYAALSWHKPLVELLGVSSLVITPELLDAAGLLVVGSGVLGVLCSVMVYVVTGRVWWSASRTAYRFSMTSVTLGLATSVLLGIGLSALGRSSIEALESARVLAWLLVGAATAKLLWEAGVLVHLKSRRLSDLKRTALLLRGELRQQSVLRLTLGALGGVAFPWFIARGLEDSLASAPSGLAVLAALAFVLLLASELMERSLFFTAVSTARMPGSIGQ